MQRRRFLGAGAAGALVLAGCGGGGDDETTTAAGGTVGTGVPGAPDDGAVLAYMLGLERLQLELYTKTASFFRGTERELVQSLAAEENDHVVRLTAALKSRRRALPRPLRLRAVPADRNGALSVAYRLENLTASAYLGQIGRIADAGVLATMLSIHSVEGRHAAAVGALLGKTATPDGAVAVGHNMATISRALGDLVA